ncbi:MAG: hypothetical protein MHMPM18_004286 [Marteilia pararefringens]
MLTVNLNVKTGLVNGACGTVRKIVVTGSGTSDIREENEDSIPSNAVLALTIHKSQGLTLNKVKLYLGKSEDTPGLTFDGVSRVRRLHDIKVYDLTRRRIIGLFAATPTSKKYASLERRLQECERVKTISTSPDATEISNR